ncbi:MAG: phenylacetate--CoA ligase family protein [Candidatus Magasanikbacteria bacterium]|nr:phenylacetate--CoA ligase family protein [Candidatus Magasanikbacteria bacterium]
MFKVNKFRHGFGSTNKFLSALKSKSEEFWVKRGEKMVLKLFKEMSVRVPAYRDFLKKHTVKAAAIKTIKDFSQLPRISKENYLRQYDLSDLCWDGQLKEERWTISSTSGSTGEPFYFPRTALQDDQYALVAELYLLTNFKINKRSTLYVDAFPMGPWIGGVFTYEAIRMVAERGKYSLSIFTAGIDKKEVIKAVRKFGHSFDQILIGSYAPFLKDILDDGVEAGINWKDYNLGFIFSAEGFSEKFRDYVGNLAGINVVTSTLNHYGTVDLGTMAYETPVSILTRRLSLDSDKIFANLFGSGYKLPTLGQYLPEMFYFEENNNGLLCSGYSGLPLVRYDLHDRGGVHSYKHIDDVFKKHNVNLNKEAKNNKIEDTVWQLPFVYIYERDDFSVSFFAFLIYPETIRRALQNDQLLSFLTGKFTMQVQYDSQLDQILEINVELKNNQPETSKLRELVTKIITEQLRQESSEYRKTNNEKGNKVLPRIIFWPYEDSSFFKPGTKQKWVKK